MRQENPRLFIGSSGEAADNGIVDLFADAFSDVADCVPWTTDALFRSRGSATTFDALCMAANDYDYGIFVCTADDRLDHRGQQCMSPRDNVIFEFGLFMSAIGPVRVLAYAQGNAGTLRLPSDLSGVNAPQFFFDKNDMHRSRSSVYDVTRGFSETIATHRFRKIDLQLVNEWGFDSDSREFRIDLSAAKLTRARSTIGLWSTTIAARVKDKYSNLYDDNRVVYSDIRSIPQLVNDNVHFKIAESAFKGAINKGAKIEARVLLVPPSLTFDPSATLSRAVNARCRDVESVSYTC